MPSVARTCSVPAQPPLPSLVPLRPRAVEHNRFRAQSLTPVLASVSPKPRSVPPSQPSHALPNAGCEFLLSDRTSANKKGTKDSCAQVSNSPTCLLGQLLPLLRAGSTGSPRTLPSIPDSTRGREELGGGKEKICGRKVGVGKDVLVPGWLPAASGNPGCSVPNSTRSFPVISRTPTLDHRPSDAGSSQGFARLPLHPTVGIPGGFLFPGLRLGQPYARRKLAAAQVPSAAP